MRTAIHTTTKRTLWTPDHDDMIADLEAFRKNPGVSLDFELEDLRPEEEDEPTRPIRVASPRGTAVQQHKAAPAYERERRRDYEDDEPVRSKKQTVLMVIAGILAVALAAVLLRSILGSFQPPVLDSSVVPNVLGYTLEEAEALDSVVEGGFQIVLKDDEPFYSEEYGVGKIARQSPAEGDVRKGDNRVITVWISAGEETGEMPYVLNKTVPDALAEMRSLKEKYNLVFDSSEEQFSEITAVSYTLLSPDLRLLPRNAVALMTSKRSATSAIRTSLCKCLICVRSWRTVIARTIPS